jgi:hypothetical protein
MLAKYDPVKRRSYWLKFGLKIETEFDPASVVARARPNYVHHMTSSMVDAFLVGLADEVRPTLEKIVAWMETQPEPDRLVFSGAGENWDAWWVALYEWRQALGLCKWLSRGDRAERELTASVRAEWVSLEQPTSELSAIARAALREFLTPRLATALAGNASTLGLKLYEAAGVKRPSGPVAPILRFGQWACRHLAEGGARDADFVARGKDMLTASLLPKFFWEGARIEPALWLKAIYFDSGVVRTPEQAIAKAYDSMPGVERPNFVPG